MLNNCIKVWKKIIIKLIFKKLIHQGKNCTASLHFWQLSFHPHSFNCPKFLIRVFILCLKFLAKYVKSLLGKLFKSKSCVLGSLHNDDKQESTVQRTNHHYRILEYISIYAQDRKFQNKTHVSVIFAFNI